MRDTCTCAGTAPGYPQHQQGCGQPEESEEEREDEDYLLSLAVLEPLEGDDD